MERTEAEAIYEQGREVVVDLLVVLSEQVAAQDAQIAKLTARIEELERRLNRNSRNSSLPPSQDPPDAPERNPSGPSGRSQGAQPGHPGRGRKLAPIEAIDEAIDYWPRLCGCGHRFGETEREPAGEPARHQVSELPEISVEISEHRLHRLRCPDCGQGTRAKLPPEVPRGAFGPRLKAAVATLGVRNRVSRRDTVELFEELFGARLSAGTVDAILERVGDALDPAYEELLAQVRTAEAVNIDETGWRLRGKRRTLWGATTPTAAIFRIAPDRYEREAIALLGEDFKGVVGSGRWWAYRGFDPACRQICWSHLIRDFTAHAGGLAAQKEFGERGLAIAGRLFRAWGSFGEHGDRRCLRREVAPLKRELKALLYRGSKGKRHRFTRGFSKNLLKVWPALWTFVEQDGGERTIERLLSASVTCRLQHRSLFAYLTDVLGASARGSPVPLLV